MTAERIYSALLYLYPKAFRDEYGGAMRETFRDMRDGSPRRAPLAFWRVVVIDAIRSAAREHIDTRRSELLWLATCAAGLLSTVATAHAIAWAFGYFYHPYFEGLRIQPWAYGATLGLVLGGTVGLSQWALVPDRARRVRGWALASAIALPIAVLLCATVVERSLAGMNPVAANTYSARIAALMYDLLAPPRWTAIAVEFTAMSIGGLTVGMLTRPLVWRRHAH